MITRRNEESAKNAGYIVGTAITKISPLEKLKLRSQLTVPYGLLNHKENQVPHFIIFLYNEDSPEKVLTSNIFPYYF